jgi:RNA polymerase sigma-70 factor (ECF subfamily)
MSNDFYQKYIIPFAPMIIKICRAYTDNDDDFQDYYQEVCLQIWQSRDRFNEKSKWSTWVYRIALNVCLSLKRKSNNELEKQSKIDVADMHATNQAFHDEQLNMLYAAIKTLSEVDRAVILLYLEEKSYHEIADITGTNTNNIGVRINRIKEKLKHKLYGSFN